MARQPNRKIYRARLNQLVKQSDQDPQSLATQLEMQAHWAKYICVLTSGYIEQAVKEIMLRHSKDRSAPNIASYIENSWPNSKNMNCDQLAKTLKSFDKHWESEFQNWLNAKEERKEHINQLVSWRNNIAHGNERNTNGVTIRSVSTHFKSACELIDFIEGLAKT